MNINKWLDDFKACWVKKDILALLELFSEDLEYWETPYKCLSSKNKIVEERQAIISQQNIELSMSIFSSLENNHTVLWSLSYTTEHIGLQEWAGTYLIMLDPENKCYYFYQTGEKRS